MAETIYLYKYDINIHLMLANDNNKTVNPPMNNKIIKVYKGVSTVLNFFIKDNDRKPVNLNSGTLTAYLVDHTTKSLLFSRELVEIENVTGKATLTISDVDLTVIKSGFYELAVTLTNNDGQSLPLFVDRSDNTKVTIELKDGPIPGFEDSITTTFSIPGGIGDKTYSSAISVSDTNNVLHTLAIYHTNYTGNIYVEGSIESTSAASGFFPISIGSGADYKSYTASTSGQLIDSVNFTSNLTWIRFAHDPDAANVGTVDKILYRS